MRARDDALTTLLSTWRRERGTPWRSGDWKADNRGDDRFALHADVVCGAVQDNMRSSTGNARSAERIRERVIDRDTRHMRRMALDLQRLADLEERMSVRNAQTARRRWFVLGRVLEKAAAQDARWAAVLVELLAQAVLSRAEATVLGLRR